MTTWAQGGNIGGGNSQYTRNKRLAEQMAAFQPVQNGGMAGALASALAGFGSGYYGAKTASAEQAASRGLADAMSKMQGGNIDLNSLATTLVESGIPEYQQMGTKLMLESGMKQQESKALGDAFGKYRETGDVSAIAGVPGGLDMAVNIKKLNEGNNITPYQQEMINLRRQEIEAKKPVVNPETGQPERKLSATEQKELFDTMDLQNSGTAAVNALTQAKNILTNSPEGSEPYTGFAAETRAAAARLPIIGDVVADKERGAATTEYRTLITEQALNNLKAIFGGMPTEGERQVLMQMQALPNFTPEEQQRIIDNAISAANNRLDFNSRKSQAIQTGQYSQMAKPNKLPAEGSQNNDIDAKINAAKAAGYSDEEIQQYLQGRGM